VKADRAFLRTSIAMFGAVAMAGLVSQVGWAQSRYPDHPVKVVVGFSAGGGTDVAGRVIAQKLSEATGQTFVVENRPGASGLIASEQVAKSPADGYTIMVGSQTTLAVAPALYRKFQLDVTKELTGLAMIGVSPLVAVVNANSPIHSIKDLIAEAKAKNGSMNFGSGGVGTTPHMAGELFAFSAGVKMVHVAYRGEAPGINDLLGGQIPFMFSNLSVVIGNIQAGKLRALAVTSPKRVAQLPDVPAIAETFPGFDAATWFALVGPAGVPRDAVMRINKETQKIVATKDYQERFNKLGMIPDQDRTPEEINAYIKAEIAKWAKVIQDAGVKPAD
jgi:tripartite-type tricarboxylate transporter receptor subunit TctC